MDGVGAADRAGPCFGQADVADLALDDQAGHGADGVLDGCVGVETVLVAQVDVIGAEPPQRALDGGTDAGRAAVETARLAAGVRDEAELRGEHDLVAAALDGPADELLVVEGTVGLGGGQQGDAEFQGPVDRTDGLRLVGSPVGPGHGHRAQADARNAELTQMRSSHDDFSLGDSPERALSLSGPAGRGPGRTPWPPAAG